MNRYVNQQPSISELQVYFLMLLSFTYTFFTEHLSLIVSTVNYTSVVCAIISSNSIYLL